MQIIYDKGSLKNEYIYVHNLMSGCLKKWWLQVVNVAVRVVCGQGLSTVIMVMVGRMLRSEVVHVGILVSVSRSGFQQGHDYPGSYKSVCL